jgi:hypothetical protein
MRIDIFWSFACWWSHVGEYDVYASACLMPYVSHKNCLSILPLSIHFSTQSQSQSQSQLPTPISNLYHIFLISTTSLQSPSLSQTSNLQSLIQIFNLQPLLQIANPEFLSQIPQTLSSCDAETWKSCPHSLQHACASLYLQSFVWNLISSWCIETYPCKHTAVDSTGLVVCDPVKCIFVGVISFVQRRLTSQWFIEMYLRKN